MTLSGGHRRTDRRLGRVDGGRHRRQVGLRRQRDLGAHQELVGAQVLGADVDQPVDVVGLLERGADRRVLLSWWRPRR